MKTAARIEDWICARVAEMARLDPKDVDREVPVTTLGLDSLNLLTLTGDLADWLQIDLPSSIFWQFPGIAHLAKNLAELNLQTAVKKGPETESSGRAVLSLSQENMWRYSRAEATRLHYQTLRQFHVEGPLELSVLQRALDEIVRRHEHLRTTFHMDGETPFQQVHPPSPAQIQFTDFSTEADPETAAVDFMLQAEKVLLEPEQGPLLVTRVLRIRPNEHVIGFQLHHILYDGRSFAVFYSELRKLYDAYQNDEPAQLPELSLQMAAFAAWERERLDPQGGFFLKELSWWKNYWNKPVEAECPFNFQHRQRFLEARADEGKVVRVVSPQLHFRIQAAAKQAGTTVYTLHFTAFVAALFQHGCQDELVLGTYVSNRSARGVDTLIGCFINLLGMRITRAGVITWAEMLNCMRSVLEEVSAHQEVPRHVINDAFVHANLSLPRPMLIYQYLTSQQQLELPGLTVKRWPPKMALPSMPTGFLLNVMERSKITAAFLFDATIYDPGAVRFLADSHFKNLEALGGNLDARMPAHVQIPWWYRLKNLLRGR